MKSMLIVFALFAGQTVTMQEKPVVHLKPHTAAIDPSFGGSLLELSNAPPTVYLPKPPPSTDVNGAPWAVDVKNFGPAPVTVVDTKTFTAVVNVSQTIHILSNGRSYILKH